MRRSFVFGLCHRKPALSQYLLFGVIHMSAKFHVDAVFSIEGRGTVLQGTIISGEISRGMLVKVPGGQSSRRVAAVEAIRGDCIPRQSLGLVLESGAPDDAKDFAALSEGKVLDIE